MRSIPLWAAKDRAKGDANTRPSPLGKEEGADKDAGVLDTGADAGGGAFGLAASEAAGLAFGATTTSAAV